MSVVFYISLLLIIQAAQEHGMGPRGSALICGYTSYHRLLESSLANLKRKEVWLLSLVLVGSYLLVIFKCLICIDFAVPNCPSSEIL